jgi:hypothetical protein
MFLHEAEKLSDWPVISVAVPCTTCGAQPGNWCVTRNSSANAMFGGGGQRRIDCHAERKAAALYAWEHRNDEAKEMKEDAGKIRTVRSESSQEEGNQISPRHLHGAKRRKHKAVEEKGQKIDAAE